VSRVSANARSASAAQRKHLEASVCKLRANLEKGVATHRADIARIMHENVTLVKSGGPHIPAEPVGK